MLLAKSAPLSFSLVQTQGKGRGKGKKEPLNSGAQRGLEREGSPTEKRWRDRQGPRTAKNGEFSCSGGKNLKAEKMTSTPLCLRKSFVLRPEEPCKSFLAKLWPDSLHRRTKDGFSALSLTL